MKLKQKEVLFMNKKGQSLVIFVLILPVIALLIAFFIDSSISIMEKNRLEGIIKSNMNEALNSNIYDAEKIKEAIKKNDNIYVSVSIENDNLEIKANSNKKSVFGNILNFDYYKLEFNYCANYNDKKINKC